MKKYVTIEGRKIYLNNHNAVIGPHGVTITPEGIIALGLRVESEPTAEPCLDIDNRVAKIQTRQALRDFATQYGTRHDWHEPDEQGLNVRIIGMHLDNAMGSTTRPIGENNSSGEFNIVLTHEDEPVAVINLATLLAWAAQN